MLSDDGLLPLELPPAKSSPLQLVPFPFPIPFPVGAVVQDGDVYGPLPPTFTHD